MLLFCCCSIFCKGTRARVKNQRPIFLTNNFPKMSEFTVHFSVRFQPTLQPSLHSAKYSSTSCPFITQNIYLLGQFKAFGSRCINDSAQNTASIYKLRLTRNLGYHTDYDSLKTALPLTFFLPLYFLCKLGNFRLSSSYVNRFRNRQPDKSVPSLMPYFVTDNQTSPSHL
jgi:hypothetical protein